MIPIPPDGATAMQRTIHRPSDTNRKTLDPRTSLVGSAASTTKWR
jgi:hypothetical protein